MSEPATSTATTDRRTILYWIARTCRELRDRRNIHVRDIAAVVQVDQGTVYRFEKAERMPQKVDQIVAAYAYLCGVDDGRDLWATAIHDWKTKGAAPFLGDLTGPGAAVLLALDARQITEQARHKATLPRDGESRAKPTSKGGRREAG